MRQVEFGTIKKTSITDELIKSTTTTKHQLGKVVSSSIDVENVIKIANNNQVLPAFLTALEDFRTSSNRTELRFRVVKRVNGQVTKLYVAYTELEDA